MPYNIEIVALGDDLYARLADTIRWLSSLQREFQFHFPPPRLLRHLVGTAATSPAPFATGTHFTTAEAWTALRSYRSIAKGDRRYLIAFTSSSLSSTKYQNLFASAEAGEGLAVVTIADQERFTASFDAYVAYYLTRYSLGLSCPISATMTIPGRACSIGRSTSRTCACRYAAAGFAMRVCRWSNRHSTKRSNEPST